jgi:hypothetical protein
MAAALTTSDPGGGGATDTDEVKVYECDTHEDDVEDNSDRLSPVIKEEEVSDNGFFAFEHASRRYSSHHHSRQHQSVRWVRFY